MFKNKKKLTEEELQELVNAQLDPNQQKKSFRKKMDKLVDVGKEVGGYAMAPLALISGLKTNIPNREIKL
jgi:hypothetical protein